MRWEEGGGEEEENGKFGIDRKRKYTQETKRSGKSDKRGMRKGTDGRNISFAIREKSRTIAIYMTKRKYAEAFAD